MVRLLAALVKPEATMSNTVQCKDCGMLAVLLKQNGEYVSPDKRFRDRGDIPHIDGEYIYDAYPFCAAMALDFHVLLGRANDANEPSGRRITINESRDCDKFVAWNPCFSPKEHKEMILSEKLLEMQRNRDDDDRRWRENEAKLQRDWQAEQASLSEKHHGENLSAAIGAAKGNVWSTLAAGALGMLGTLIAGGIATYVATRH
jgi:hypothetical protein